MIYNKWILAVVCLLSVFTVSAQQHTAVCGFVHSNGKPVENVYIEFSKDTIFEILISRADGKFSTRPLPVGDYLITTRHISYKPTRGIFSLRDTMNFPLEESSIRIEEVSIKANIRKAIRRQDGNTILNPAYLGDIRTNTTLQMMELMPSVNISSSQLSIKGLPAGLRINGHKVNLSGQALMAYLQSIPADLIKEIVIVPSSASQSASDIGGEINIMLKKEQEDSQSLSIGGQLKYIDGKMAGYSSGYYVRQQGNSYFSLSLEYENEYYKAQRNYHTVYPGAGISNSVLKKETRGNNGFGVANYDYTFKNKSVLHLNGSSYYGKNKPRGNYMQEYLRTDGVTELVSDNTVMDYTGDMFQVYADYRTNDSLPLKHNIGYGVIWGKANDLSENNSLSTEDPSAPQWGLPYNTEIQNKQHGVQQQAHYDLTFAKDKWELKAGARIELGNLTPLSHYDSIIGGIPVYQDIYSSKYKLKENIYAAYASVKYKLNRTSLAVGVRAETTDMSVRSLYDGVDWDYEKTHLFPFARINREFGVLNSTLSFSSGIDRPSYMYYTPNRRYISKYSYSTGNPHLLPAKYYKIELENLLFDFVDLTLTYIHKKDLYGSITYSGQEAFEEITTYLNYTDENMFMADLYVPYLLLNDKISGYFSSYLRYSKYTAYNEALNFHYKKYSAYGINNSTQFKIAKNFNIGYFFKFQGPFYNSQTRQKSLHYLNLNASYIYKKFTFGVQVYDLYDNRKYKGINYYSGSTMDFSADGYEQRFGISVRYNFMKGQKIKDRDNKGTDASRFQ